MNYLFNCFNPRRDVSASQTSKPVCDVEIDARVSIPGGMYRPLRPYFCAWCWRYSVVSIPGGMYRPLRPRAASPSATCSKAFQSQAGCIGLSDTPHRCLSRAHRIVSIPGGMYRPLRPMKTSDMTLHTVTFQSQAGCIGLSDARNGILVCA